VLVGNNSPNGGSPGLDPGLARRLSAATEGALKLDVPLAAVSRWQIGGLAHAVVEPRSTQQVADVLGIMAAEAWPVCVIGDTSNLLFDSAGFAGVLVRIGSRMSAFSFKGTRAWAQAGVSVPAFSEAAGEAGLTGLEHTIGIPGTLGGLVVMNGGSQRKGIGTQVAKVLTVEPTGNIRTFDREACGFAYRTSAFQQNDAVVVEVDLELEEGDPVVIRQSMQKILLERSSKFPSDQPNCGSTFMSHPDMYEAVGPPGRAVEMVGLKGVRRGGALISPLHANFVVNTGGASSDDVLWLISLMRTVVEDRTGYAMAAEARFVRRDGRIQPADEAALQRWGPVRVSQNA
jgi:UDP-N-acetylmuramate dehydrogenase